jgi:hypothetical protein
VPFSEVERQQQPPPSAPHDEDAAEEGIAAAHDYLLEAMIDPTGATTTAQAAESLLFLGTQPDEPAAPANPAPSAEPAEPAEHQSSVFRPINWWMNG